MLLFGYTEEYCGVGVKRNWIIFVTSMIILSFERERGIERRERRGWEGEDEREWGRDNAKRRR